MAEFKDRLQEAIDKAAMKPADLARITGITPSSISDWLKGKYLAKQDKINLLAKALDVSPTWLMGLCEDDAVQRAVKRKTLPLLGSVACGEPIWAEQNWQGTVSADDDLDADFCLTAQGDSMINARIHDGDIVFIRQQPTVENGQIGVVLIGNEATLKRVYFDKPNEVLQLVAENPLYAPIVFAGAELEDVHILGRAVAFQSRLN